MPSLAFCFQAFILLTDGADHEVALTEEVAEGDADEDRGDAAADEALPSLLGAELEELRQCQLFAGLGKLHLESN